jgi:hydrogenase maturation factor
VRLGGGYLVVSADPITGVSEDIGRYAVKVSANDVATSGNRPQFAESVILLPEGSSAADVRKLARQIHGAARESGVAIVGGHTEVTPGLKHPIVAVTVFSFVERFVTSGDARPGDTIMMTKTAGLEGTAELAKEKRRLLAGLRQETARKAQGLISQISIIEEAIAAFGTGRVHAMHDCTEGGVLGAVYEMSFASRIGFLLREAAVPIAPETTEVCRRLSIDPLRLIGSGSLLLAVEHGAETEIEEALRSICRVSPIGEFRRGRRVMVQRDGSRRLVKEAPEDELWRVLARRPASPRQRP